MRTWKKITPKDKELLYGMGPIIVLKKDMEMEVMFYGPCEFPEDALFYYKLPDSLTKKQFEEVSGWKIKNFYMNKK